MPNMTTPELARWYRDSGNLEVWEDIASWFQDETGHLRPGKDKPMGWHMPAMGDPDCCMEAWIKWSEQKRGEAVRGLLAQRDRYRSTLVSIANLRDSEEARIAFIALQPQ